MFGLSDMGFIIFSLYNQIIYSLGFDGRWENIYKEKKCEKYPRPI